MRIASGGVQHETNTYTDAPTTRGDFERDSMCGPDFGGGDTIFERFTDTGTIHGGYIAGAKSADFELVPLICTKAQPLGRVDQAAFDEMLGLFLSRLADAGPVDGVLLDLHGAQVNQHDDDAEGAFIKATRDALGDDMPVFVTLDLHANITPKMAQYADSIIGYDTYPHVDMFDRGKEAAELMARTVRGEVKPQLAYRQLPLLTLPPKQCTLRQPMMGLIDKLHELESRPGILTATISMGFPFADIRDAGVSVLVTADGDQTLAESAAEELAGWVWDLRDELQPELITPEELIEKEKTLSPGLIIYADGSDNPGGGAPSDGTVALQALIDAGVENACVGLIHDPETAQQAHQAGVGATIDVRLGGKADDRHGDPVVGSAKVLALSDGLFVHQGPMSRGIPRELGLTALINIGGVDVVVNTYRAQLLDAEMIRIVGLKPEDKRILVVKSAVHFRADLGPRAAHIFDADTPGIHRPDLDNFEYKTLRRPIYPLDQEVTL